MDREYKKSLDQAHEYNEVIQKLSTIIDKYGQTLTTKEKEYLLSY